MGFFLFHCNTPAGKTQLVKGKLMGLPEEIASQTITLNYFTDAVSFQKVRCVAPLQHCTVRVINVQHA